MKIIKCHGKGCKKILKPRFHSIWFYKGKEYCQECYLKLFDKCMNCKTDLKGKECKIYNNSILCVHCYNSQIILEYLIELQCKELNQDYKDKQNRKIATSRSKSNKKTNQKK